MRCHLKTSIVLLVLVLITYGDVLTHRFMIDDRLFLNPSMGRGLEDFFLKPVGQHYEPLFSLMNTQLFQICRQPWPLYLLNLGLFYLNVLLVYALIALISGDVFAAFLTAIFFCVHPMTADMLQHITFNNLFIVNALLTGALMALYSYVRDPRPAFYAGSLLGVALAFFFHEIAVLFPLYAAAMLFFTTDIRPPKALKLLMPYVFLSLGLFGFWLVLVNSHLHLEGMKTLQPALLGATMANFSHVCFWYLGNLFVPRDIVFMANKPPLTAYVWLWNGFLAAFLAVCGLGFFYFKKSLGSFALFFFLTGFIFAFPSAQARLAQGGQWVFEPNWIYFSSMGFYLFMILILLRLKQHVHRLLFVALLAIIFASDFLATWNINITARTERTYTENWLREFPGDVIASDIVASFYYNHPDIPIPPDLVPGILDRAGVYIKDGLPQGFELLRKVSSYAIASGHKQELFFEYAAYYCKNGPAEKCADLSGRIIGRGKNPDDLMRLAYTFYKTGVDPAALNLLKECMTSYPGYQESYLLMGVILGNEGKYQDAVRVWRQGLKIAPLDPRFTADIQNAQRLEH